LGYFQNSETLPQVKQHFPKSSNTFPSQEYSLGFNSMPLPHSSTCAIFLILITRISLLLQGPFYKQNKTKQKTYYHYLLLAFLFSIYLLCSVGLDSSQCCIKHKTPQLESFLCLPPNYIQWVVFYFYQSNYVIITLCQIYSD
jgi:hypothetical protein